MPWERFIIGWHGCDESIIESVLLGRSSLRKSQNDYDWLGHGIYFWEDNVERARQWAENSPRVRKPAVIGAVIDLGECLNLVDAEHLSIVRDAHAALQHTCQQAGVALPINSGKDLKQRKLDCAVIEFLHTSREQKNLHPYQTVRGFFVEGDPLYPGAGFRHQDHIQICVRDERSILGLFLERR